ncbi:MAG: hypothetical protein KJ621_20385, partial [Proteobacteria bacterium]|nr:hypothetical protein [Pseudomonadota bacterium]
LVAVTAALVYGQVGLVFREPYLQFKIAYANGFIAGAQYIARQVTGGDLEPSKLTPAYFEGAAFKQVVGAQVSAYAARLQNLNKVKQPTPSP